MPGDDKKEVDRDSEESRVENNPDMALAQMRFLLSAKETQNKAEIKDALIKAITEQEAAPLYAACCSEFGWMADDQLEASLKAKNEAQLAKLTAAIKDAEKELGETEVREAFLQRAEYLCRIGAKEQAVEAFRETFEKTVSLGQRMDLTFNVIRLGMFWNDRALVNAHLDKAASLLEQGGDWDRKNRLKVYQGVTALTVRDFSKASRLFLESVATFTSYELMDYKEFVSLTVLMAVFACDRPEIKKKVVGGPEIQEQLHEAPLVKSFLSSLYQCRYRDLFTSLAALEGPLRENRFLAQHTHFYIKEMRIKAYTQLLQSYRSLTLASMADSFGVTEAFIDSELSRFVAAGRIHCKIDKVAGVVETNRPDVKNALYQDTIKKGDILLNRIQKLSQVINI